MREHCNQIQVTAAEYEQVQLLALSRQSFHRAAAAQFVEQQHERGQVEQVSAEPEEVQRPRHQHRSNSLFNNVFVLRFQLPIGYLWKWIHFENRIELLY